MKPDGIIVKYILSNRQGFTFFEIILAIIILVIAIIPMVNAFAPSLLSSGYSEEQAVLTAQARSTMNRLIDLSFQTLNANQGNPLDSEKLIAVFGSQAEVDKETLSYRGQSYAPVIAVTDASGGVGGLLELTVILKDVKLKTLRAEH